MISAWFVGPPALGRALATEMAGDVDPFTIVDLDALDAQGPSGPAERTSQGPSGPAERTSNAPSAVIDAVALDRTANIGAACEAIDQFARREAGRPARLVRIVPLSWLGRVADAAEAGRAAHAVASARATALALAATATTVNVVVVPEGFPHAAPTSSTPIPDAVGPADLAHVLRYLLDPDNGYLVGQVLSVCGGDDVWGNLAF
ncbi:MAG TPA: hypothetical protein VGQ20_01725 [Acidimicrobiales bacterium]|nr:hypothetical protein [Acidimicrobiales bacterium]